MTLPKSLDTLRLILEQTNNPRNFAISSEGDTIETFLSNQHFQPSCPCCQNNRLVRHGKTSIGRQRWKCSGCGHTFVETATTPFYRSRSLRETWLHFMHCVEKRIPLRKAASICGISLPTAIRWRRRYLYSLAEMLKTAAHALRDQGLCAGDVDWDEIDRYIETEVRKLSRGKSDMPRKRRRRMVAKQGKQHFH